MTFTEISTTANRLGLTLHNVGNVVYELRVPDSVGTSVTVWRGDLEDAAEFLAEWEIEAI